MHYIEHIDINGYLRNTNSSGNVWFYCLNHRILLSWIRWVQSIILSEIFATNNYMTPTSLNFIRIINLLSDAWMLLVATLIQLSWAIFGRRSHFALFSSLRSGCSNSSSILFTSASQYETFLYSLLWFLYSCFMLLFLLHVRRNSFSKHLFRFPLLDSQVSRHLFDLFKTKCCSSFRNLLFRQLFIIHCT